MRVKRINQSAVRDIYYSRIGDTKILALAACGNMFTTFGLSVRLRSIGIFRRVMSFNQTIVSDSFFENRLLDSFFKFNK
jgi:hypothetical protein